MALLPGPDAGPGAHAGGGSPADMLAGGSAAGPAEPAKAGTPPAPAAAHNAGVLLPPGQQPGEPMVDESSKPAAAPGAHAGAANPGGGPDQGARQALEGVGGGGVSGQSGVPGGLEGSEAAGKGGRAGDAAPDQAPAPDRAPAPQDVAPKGAALLAQLASAVGAPMPQEPGSAPASYPQLLQAFDVTMSGAHGRRCVLRRSRPCLTCACSALPLLKATADARSGPWERLHLWEC